MEKFHQWYEYNNSEYYYKFVIFMLLKAILMPVDVRFCNVLKEKKIFFLQIQNYAMPIFWKRKTHCYGQAEISV
jgi:hypothetical protein